MGKQFVRVKGLDVLKGRLAKMPRLVDAGAVAATKVETHNVAEDLRDTAPVLSGAMKAGIRERIVNKGKTGRAVSTAKYTTFVVHGTSKQERNDFMTPAAERSRQRFPDVVRRETRAQLFKVAK